MGILSKKVPNRYYRPGFSERGPYRENRRVLTGAGKSLAALSLIMAGGVLVHDDFVDVLGDKGRERTDDEVREVAQEHYDNAFAAADASGRYSLQFTSDSSVTVRRFEGGNGLAGGLESTNATAYFNNSCLNNTAYDIDGGSFNFSLGGLFVSAQASGDVPTAAATAYVSTEDPDTLIIQSGNANGVDLTFSGIEGGSKLEPANGQTVDVLQTYGCELDAKPMPVNSYKPIENTVVE